MVFKILKFLVFFFSWLRFVLKFFFIMLVQDFIFLLKSLQYYFIMLFIKKSFSVKNVLLYFYLIYPLYFILKFIFLIYILVLRYFIFIFFCLLFLIDLFVSTKFINLYLQRYLKNSLFLYNNFSQFFDQGLFTALIKFLKLIIFYTLYFIIYELIPLALLPFVIIFVFFRAKIRTLYDFYFIKFFYPVRTTLPYLYRKLALQVVYFYDYWFFAILKFLFFLIPFYSWQTFLPLILNYLYIFINKFLLNIIYYTVFYFYLIIYMFIYILNLIFYSIYLFFKLFISIFSSYLNNLYYFFYLIFFKFPYSLFTFILFIFNIRYLYYLLLVAYLDFKSLFTMFKYYIKIKNI